MAISFLETYFDSVVPYLFHFATVVDVTQGGSAHDRVNLNKEG